MCRPPRVSPTYRSLPGPQTGVNRFDKNCRALPRILRTCRTSRFRTDEMDGQGLRQHQYRGPVRLARCRNHDDLRGLRRRCPHQHDAEDGRGIPLRYERRIQGVAAISLSAVGYTFMSDSADGAVTASIPHQDIIRPVSAQSRPRPTTSSIPRTRSTSWACGWCR